MSISAKKIGMTIGGVTVSGTYRYGRRGKVDELDRTTGEDAGYANFDGGVKELRITATIYVDLTDGLGVVIEEGDEPEDVVLYRDLDGLISTTVPVMLVVSAEESAEVRGKVEYTLEMVAKGAYAHTAAGA